MSGLKYLITGSRGQLGSELVEIVGNAAGGDQIVPVDFNDYDLSKEEEIDAMFQEVKPMVIVHCGAYTDVEGAEDNEELCMKVNFSATKRMVENSFKTGVKKFIFISTNYVFDGTKTQPYSERDEARPLSVYGMSKYLAEKEVLTLSDRAIVIRTSALFGMSTGESSNFVQKILSFARNPRSESIRVINDELVNPTYTVDLAFAIKMVIEHTNTRGIFHITNSGEANWYDFAKNVISLASVRKQLVPIKQDEYECKAKRPKNGLLDCKKLKAYTNLELRSWQNALEDYLYSIGEIKNE